KTALPHPARCIGSVRLRCDLASFWHIREQFLSTKAVSESAQFAGFMAILFAGKDFGEDILPEILPDVEIVVARQSYEPGNRVPKVKIPAFAAIYRLKNPATLGPLLEVAFQTTLGVTNADRGQKGMMPMVIRPEVYKGTTITHAE